MGMGMHAGMGAHIFNFIIHRINKYVRNTYYTKILYIYVSNIHSYYIYIYIYI